MENFNNVLGKGIKDGYYITGIHPECLHLKNYE